MSVYDILALALTLPPAVAWGLDIGQRRARWQWVGFIATGAAVSVATVTTGFVFAPMRVLCNVLFVTLPFALALASGRARRAGRRASSLGGVPAWAFAGVAALLVGVAVDAFFVEPRALGIERHEIRSARVERRLRFVILADLQFDEWGDYEREAIDRAAAEEPDVVLFPGDFVQKYGAERRAVLEAARDYIDQSALRPPLGSYAVAGNIEVDGWEKMFPERMTTLSSSDVDRGAVRVTGLTLGESFDRNLVIRSRRDGRKGGEVGTFHVVVGHAPDFSLGHIDADLLVAGHTHGGQVQLPFIGPLVTFSAVPREQAAGGVFTRPDGSHLVVSRGIGMERGDAPRLRFLCTPQIVVIDVVPDGQR